MLLHLDPPYAAASVAADDDDDEVVIVKVQHCKGERSSMVLE